MLEKTANLLFAKNGPLSPTGKRAEFFKKMFGNELKTKLKDYKGEVEKLKGKLCSLNKKLSAYSGILEELSNEKHGLRLFEYDIQAQGQTADVIIQEGKRVNDFLTQH